MYSYQRLLDLWTIWSKESCAPGLPWHNRTLGKINGAEYFWNDRMMCVHCWGGGSTSLPFIEDPKDLFVLALLALSGSFMVEIWDDWRRGSSWGETQPKDNVCARVWHLAAAGASGTDAAPALRFRADVLPGLSGAARLHQRLQLQGRAIQSARRPGCGEKSQLQQEGADWTSRCQSAPQQDRHSVSWRALQSLHDYCGHPFVTYCAVTQWWHGELTLVLLISYILRKLIGQSCSVLTWHSFWSAPGTTVFPCYVVGFNWFNDVIHIKHT